MLRIPTLLATSRIPGAGLGLFCKAPVAAGALIWRFDAGFDVVLEALPEDPVLRRFAQVYGYRPLEGVPRWILCLDDARFINHSAAPNTDDVPDVTTARRDLAAGEEITSDYRAFCRDPFGGWELPPARGQPSMRPMTRAV